jgi:DNA modification methylase
MKKEEKIICLGKEFNSDEERREYFRKELRTRLPELRKIDGFPIGEDENIINLSDPPYYVACPNPWLNDFILKWEDEKENVKGRMIEFHVAEPYSFDVSEGKNNPIYNAHSYHTKVPHPAIMRYLLHYTQPGDIILDGFAGTGMTGVAAQICDRPDSELKYLIEKEFLDQNLKTVNWGKRNAICGDLSPVASFIAANYNIATNIDEFEIEANNILEKLDRELGWMFTTHNSENNKECVVNYTVWSDVFICNNCNSDIVFYEAAVNQGDGTVNEEFTCPSCKSEITKKALDRKWSTVYDFELNENVKIQKTIPVLINYQSGKKDLNKKPDKYDLEKIEKISSINLNEWFPKFRMMEGTEARRNERSGITHIHQFYSKRNLIYLSKFRSHSNSINLLLLLNSQLINLSKLNRFRPGVSFPYNPLSGTLYIGSQVSEANPSIALRNKMKRLTKAFSLIKSNQVVTTNSATNLSLISSDSIDYIFTDPPFGANISYSELNFIWECWLKVITDIRDEAIENKGHGKSLLDYQELMTICFQEYFRVLKPGKWMTVEFSNTSAAVWNGIQTALQLAGFVIANVSALDKQQGSFKAVTTTTAVKQDLVISCYKPTPEFETKFRVLHGERAVWDFVEEHLQHLSIHIKKENSTTAVIERSPKIIFDRLIAFYLMRGLSIPIDARDFQDGLEHRFVERDGMYFTTEQVSVYDEKKAKAPQFVQLSLLVASENEGIEWLRNELKHPQTTSDLHPKWLKAIAAVRKNDIMPELKDLLELNFLKDKEGKWHVPDLNEAKVRETLRTKILLKEFDAYVTAISQPKAKKLKEVRVEALHAGFKNCWEQKDFRSIVTLGDMIPQNILLEDEKLLMYYDIAKDRV